MKKILGLMFLTVLLFASCASFPEKQAIDDAMLIVPIVLDKSNPGTIFGDMQITIADENGAEVDSLKLTATSDYKYVILKPGIYSIDGYKFLYRNNKQGSVHEENIFFEIFPGTITVLNQYMLYDFYKIPQKPDYFYMRGRFQDMTPEVKAMIDSKLAKEEAIATWEMAYPGMY